MIKADKLFVLLRRTIIYGLAIFVVTAAVALSIARIILPQVQGYRENIQQTLGQLIDQKVLIESVDARLVGLTPTLIFRDVKMMDKDGNKELVSFSETHLGISVIESLSQKTLVPSSFSVIGTTLSIIQQKDGSFLIQGYDVSSLVAANADSRISQELADWLMQQASIKIRKSTVVLKLRGDEKTHKFDNVSLALNNRGDRHQLTGSFSLPEHVGKQSSLAMDITGDLMKPEEWQGPVYLKAKGFKLSAFGIQPEFNNLKIKDGVSDFTLWGDWVQGEFENISGDMAVSMLEVENIKLSRKTVIDRLKAKFDWHGSKGNWKMHLAELEFMRGKSLWKESSIIASRKRDKSADLISVNVAYAKLGDLRQLLLESNLYEGDYLKLIRDSKPKGEVRNFYLQVREDINRNKTFSVSANLKGFGVDSTSKTPGIQGVNAYINFNEDYGRIDLEGKDMLVSHPRLFRYPIPLQQLSTSIELERFNNGWLVNSKDFLVSNEDLKMKTSLMMFLSDKRKRRYLDLQLSSEEVDITKIYKYQPTRLMKEKLVKWIDSSFQKGKVVAGNMSYRGWLHQFPFRQYAGVLNGGFHAKDVNMFYFPNWPMMEDLEAKGEFDNRGITVKSLKASLHGGEIKNLVVKIEDFKKPILVATGDAYGSTHNGIHFFSKTPVGFRTKRFANKNIFKGDSHVNMEFSVALDKELAKKYKKRFSGYVETSNSEFHLMHNRMPVTDIKGRIYFSSEKHHSDIITAKMLNGPAKIWITSEILGPKPVATIHGEGNFDAVMLDRNFKKLGLMRVYGRVPWKAKLRLGYQKSANSPERENAQMEIKTDLVGVEIDLPEPYKKAAEISRPSIIRSTFLPSIKTILNVQYGDRMSTEMRMNNNYFPARIEIGEMKLSAGKAKLPEKDEFRMSGVVSNVDQYKWREVMQEHYNKYRKLRTRPIVDVPVIVDFAYVSVPFDKEKAKPRKRYTSPIIMPAFKGQVRQFVFAGKKIGKVEFDSRKDKLGLAFDKLKVTSPDMEYNGTMTWHYINNWHRTKAKGQFKIHNLGNLVTNFGMKDKAEDGEGTVDIDFNWENPFYVFRPGYTNGNVKLNLEDGVVTAINPGAGRFLGLLNISNLPRRLLLDFKDAGSGFAYDTLTGTINLKEGIAKTTDVAVDSTIADILAVGKVDLRKKEFDSVVTVTPQIAGTMPVVSGLLMGTGVIPIVWLFERMFGSDMDKSLSRQYQITGPWKKPVVKRIDISEEDEDV